MTAPLPDFWIELLASASLTVLKALQVAMLQSLAGYHVMTWLPAWKFTLCPGSTWARNLRSWALPIWPIPSFQVSFPTVELGRVEMLGTNWIKSLHSVNLGICILKMSSQVGLIRLFLRLAFWETLIQVLGLHDFQGLLSESMVHSQLGQVHELNSGQYTSFPRGF